MRYQLLPQFSNGPTYSTKNPKTGRNKKISTFNARLHSLEIRKAWSGNFMNRHCIIPFRNFFEWVELQGSKKEIAFSSQKYPLMWAAGIYDNWKDPKEDLSIDSFAIITTEPRPEVLEMSHDRCPIFIKGQLIDQWLEAKSLTKPQAYALLNQQEEDIFKHKWV
jgi:putative SOS response-associated peptidase YedK